MVEAQSYNLSPLQSGSEDRREMTVDLENQLTAKITVDTVKNFVMVESTSHTLTTARTAKLAKVVNDKNLTDSAGGYIYKEGKLHYRTSTLFAKGEFPEEVIRQMIGLHQAREVRANLEGIKRDAELGS